MDSGYRKSLMLNRFIIDEVNLSLNKEPIHDKLTLVNAYKSTINQVDYMVDSYLMQANVEEEDRQLVEANRSLIVEQLDRLMREHLDSINRGKEIDNHKIFYILTPTEANRAFSLIVFICDLKMSPEATALYNKKM
jgi:hypothetical protein